MAKKDAEQLAYEEELQRINKLTEYAIKAGITVGSSAPPPALNPDGSYKNKDSK
jgi:hypothetical protein